MKPIQIALVSTSEKVSFTKLTQIAAALRKQLTRDFAPIWGITATINEVPVVDQIREGHWHMIIQDGPIPGGGVGYHHLLKRKGKPTISIAQVSANQDHVSLTCSHELLEMLVNRTDKKLSPPSIPPLDPDLPPPLQPDTRVRFLMEICDPCQADNQSYDIDGVKVCNFCTPEYYQQDKENKRRFFQGGSGWAREVLGGGYVSFQTSGKKWWRTDFFFNNVKTSPEPAGAVATGHSAEPPKSDTFPQPATVVPWVTPATDAARPKPPPQP
jgi:hypothetical protein